MTYAEAVAHLDAAGPELLPGDKSAPRRKFDLAHMRKLCQALGNPQSRVPSVLIAGTNGKGSTAATLASILTSAGYRTGLYTSPHLSRVNERIQLSHPTLPTEYGSASQHGSQGRLSLTPIPDGDFARIYDEVNHVAEHLVSTGELPQPPSFFERLTAIAFVYFAEKQQSTEIMVLEVGLGGRLDATNVVEPLLSVITDISLDHQNYLGNSISEIASEKAGILRDRGVLVTLSQHPDANQSIGLVAAGLNVRGVDAAPYLPPPHRNTPETAVHRRFDPRNRYDLVVCDSRGQQLLKIDSPLAGEHQRRNMALAIASAKELRNSFGYTITDDALQVGIKSTSWPGRLEFLAPNLLLDVAHNPAGAWALRAAISALPEDQPRTLLFSCLQDKDLGEMSRILFPLFDSSADQPFARQHDHIVLVSLANPRAMGIEDLIDAAKRLGIQVYAAPHPEAALAQALKVTPPDGLIIATGSLYLVGALRQLVLSQVSPHG